MAAGKLYKDIPRLYLYLKVIEQYNNFQLLGANEEIKFIKEKIDNLYKITDVQKIIEDFKWCANMVQMFYDEIDPEFKKDTLIAIAKEREGLW
jgi:hypothetical protein